MIYYEPHVSWSINRSIDKGVWRFVILKRIENESDEVIHHSGWKYLSKNEACRAAAEWIEGLMQLKEQVNS